MLVMENVGFFKIDLKIRNSHRTLNNFLETSPLFHQ